MKQPKKSTAAKALQDAKCKLVGQAYKVPPAPLVDPLTLPEPPPDREHNGPGRRARGAVELDEGRDVTALCRALTVKAVRALEAVLDDPAAKHTPKIAAAAQILNRGWGMPAQRMEVTRKGVTDMSEAELERIVREETQAAKDSKEAIPAAIADLLPR